MSDSKRAKTQTNSSTNVALRLPTEILSLILRHFQKTEESLFISLVCKQWNSIINHQKFSYRQVIEYYSRIGTTQSLQLIRNFVK